MALEETGVQFVTEGEDAYAKSMDSAADSTNLFQQAAESAGGGIDVFQEIVTGALRKVGEVALEALGAAIGMVTDFAKASFAGALEAEEGLARLRAQLMLTGEASNFNESQALALAQKYKDLVGGSDDAVLAIQEMGLRMGITGDEMEQFIVDTLNLSEVTGSAENAGFLLALAQEDVVAAMTKARRAGIILTDEQEKNIKSLVEEGKTVEATAAFMAVLQSKTEGLAEAMSGTTAGKLAIFQEHIADIGESIVTSFLPAITGAFDKIAPLIEEGAQAIGAFFDAISGGDIGGAFDVLTEFDVVRDFFSNLGISTEQIWAFGGMVEDFVTNLPTMIEGAVTAVQPITDAFIGLFGAVAEDGPAFQATAQGMFEAVQTGLGAVSPEFIASIGATIDNLTDIWTRHGDTILATVGVAWNTVVSVITLAIGTIGGLLEGFTALTSGVMDAYSLMLNGKFGEAFAMAQDAWSNFFTALYDGVTNGLDAVFQIWGTNLEDVQAAISNSLMDVTADFQTFIINLINTASAEIPRFIKIGQEWFEGIKAGILLKATQLRDAVVGVINDTIEAARTALGIASPSKVGMEDGANYGGAMAMGVESQVDNMRSAVGDLTASMVNPPMGAGMQSTYNNQRSTTVNNTVNANYAYSRSPVDIKLDLMAMMAVSGAGA